MVMVMAMLMLLQVRLKSSDVWGIFATMTFYTLSV